MKNKLINLISPVPIFLIMIFVSPSANAAHYIFSQGFSEGGIITGSFDGEDFATDPFFNTSTTSGPDGLISMCNDRGCNSNFGFGLEVTKFSIRFSGNKLFRKLNSLPGSYASLLVYDVRNSMLSLDTTAGDLNKGLLNYSSDFGEILLFKESEVITATATESISVAVAQAPLPNALILFATGIVFLFVIAKRKTFPVINSKVQSF